MKRFTRGQAFETGKTFVLKFANDWSMNLASMIAYSLITAIFPILLTVLSVAGIVLQGFLSAHVADLAHTIDRAFPEARQGGINLIPPLKSLIQITGPLAIVSLAGLLWLGSNLFCSIENAFSIIFRIRGRDLLHQRIMAVGMVLILTVLLPVSLGAASLVTAGSSDFLGLLPRRLSGTLQLVGPLTSLGVLWLLFVVIYMVVPNIKVHFRYAWRGALTATLLFGILQLLFPYYFTIFLTGNTRYGAAAASLLVVIIWLWFFALITVIGAQINAVAMGLVATPYDLGRSFEVVYDQHTTAAQRVASSLRPPQPPRAARHAPQGRRHGRR